MKRHLLRCGRKHWALAALGLGMSAAAWAQPDPRSASPILGFQRLVLEEGWHAVGPPLEPFAALAGTIQDLRGAQLTLQTAEGAPSWAADRWRGYEARIDSGPAAGRRYAVLGNNDAWLALGSEPAADGVLPGDAVSLRPTLAEYLGNQLAGGDLAAADWVGAYASNALARVHRDARGEWVNDTGVPARLTVRAGGGFLVNVQPGARRALVLMGEWGGGPAGGGVVPGQQVLSAPQGGAPVTIGGAFGVGRTGVGPQAGATPEESDRLTLLDPRGGERRSCWLDAGRGEWLWRDTGEPAGDWVLEPGRGYLYYHASQGFSWRWR